MLDGNTAVMYEVVGLKNMQGGRAHFTAYYGPPCAAKEIEKRIRKSHERRFQKTMSATFICTRVPVRIPGNSILQNDSLGISILRQQCHTRRTSHPPNMRECLAVPN